MCKIQENFLFLPFMIDRIDRLFIGDINSLSAHTSRDFSHARMVYNTLVGWNAFFQLAEIVSIPFALVYGTFGLCIFACFTGAFIYSEYLITKVRSMVINNSIATGMSSNQMKAVFRHFRGSPLPFLGHSSSPPADAACQTFEALR